MITFMLSVLLSAPAPFDAVELAKELAAGPRRIDVDFDKAHKPKEVTLDDDKDDKNDKDKLRDKVVSVTGNIVVLEQLGQVDVSAATDLEIDSKDLGRDAWLAEVSKLLAAGKALEVEAEGTFGAGGLVAVEADIRKKAHRVELELTASATHFDPVAKTLVVGSVVLPLGNAKFKKDR